MFMNLSDYLFVRLLANGRLEYGLYNDNDEFVQFEAAKEEEIVSQFDDASASRKAILIVPGEDVLLTTRFVPSRQRKQVQQAIPFLIEDLLLTDIDSAHMTIMEIGMDKLVSVAVTSHENMQDWVATFRKQGIDLDAIIPESLLVPFREQSITVLFDDRIDKVLLRTGRYTGGTSNLENLAVLLNSLLKEQNKGDAGIITLSGTREDLLDHIKLYCQSSLAADNVLINSDIVNQTTLSTLSGNYRKLPDKEKHQISLMQGKYREEKEGEGKNVGWRAVALAAGILFAVQVVLNIFSGSFLSIKAAEIEKESIALYQSLFPQDTRIVNIRIQMQNHLDGSGDGDSGENNFFQLLGSLSRQLNQGMDIQFIRYNGSDGVLMLELKAASLAQLDTLERNLNDRGFVAEVASATQENEVFRGRIEVSGNADYQGEVP